MLYDHEIRAESAEYIQQWGLFAGQNSRIKTRDVTPCHACI